MYYFCSLQSLFPDEIFSRCEQKLTRTSSEKLTLLPAEWRLPESSSRWKMCFYWKFQPMFFFSLKLDCSVGFTFDQKNTMTTQRQRQYMKSQLWLLNRICQTIQWWETQRGNTTTATKHEIFDGNRGSLMWRSSHQNQSPHTHTHKDYHSTNQGVFEARLQAGCGSV